MKFHLFHSQREKRQSTTDRSGSSQISILGPNHEGPASNSGVKSASLPIPIPTTSGVLPTHLAVVQGSPAIGPIQDKLEEAWNAIKHHGAKDANKNRGLEVIGKLTTKANIATPFMPVMTATLVAAEQSEFGKAVKEGIEKFSEGIPVLMDALDELKSVHPVIGVVVLAFKTAYTLYQKRRDNDQKVISLYVGMRDMMGVLFILKDVKNDKLIAPDGLSIEDRLKTMVQSTADDIKTCSNVCDAYMKKRPLAKVVLSPVWDTKLLGFTKLFAQRRQDLEFELTMHTSQGVDKANKKLDDISEQMSAMMKVLFQELVSPEQKRLSELLEEKGGVESLRNNDQDNDKLKALIKVEKIASKSSSQPNVEGHYIEQARPNGADLEVDNDRHDIFEHPDAAIENNWTVFSRKFEAQRNHMIHELSLVAQRESDRVIREVQGSAHERIRDQSIHKIWLEMNWRDQIRARYFVLALQDYYLEKLSQSKGTAGLDTTTKSIHLSSNPDAWAIKYIDVMWVQPIWEAFDDDASGFITITEVNNFTSSRPANWSLLHWLAFWAVGFKSSIIKYTRKIEDLFAKMEGVRTTVLPPNREAVDDYFSNIWEPVHTLTAAVLSLDGVYDVEKFTSYIEAEEARLGKNLRDVDYVVDEIETLTLITGKGRIEKTLFPLLYLLLKHHYEIMRIMRTKVVNIRELIDAKYAIACVCRAIRYRVEDLTNNFSQQTLDPEKQFQTFAYGMFKYVYNKKALWTVDYVRSLKSEVTLYCEDNEDQNIQPRDILNYAHKDGLSLDNWMYDRHSVDTILNDDDVEQHLKDLFGHWHGYLYNVDGTYCLDSSMITLVLVPAQGEQHIKGNGWSSDGRYTVAGSWSKDENGAVHIKLKVLFNDLLVSPVFCNGHLDTKRDALTVVWTCSTETDYILSHIEFRRMPPRYLNVYPSIRERSDDKPRAMWRFAIAAVRNDIRRDHWSWSYFSQRRDDRETVVPLLIRSCPSGPMLSVEERLALSASLRRLTPDDACFYRSKANIIRANIHILHSIWCGSCHVRIRDARLFCLDCVIKDPDLYDTVTLCTAPQGIDARTRTSDHVHFTLEDSHEPTHRLVKARVKLLERNFGRIYAKACHAFDIVEEVCVKIAKSSSHSPEETDPNEQKLFNLGPTSTGIPAQGEGETGDRIIARDQVQDLPTCGNCKGSLSFPFWYCVFCEDDLFICNACDAEGVPDLERSSGKHTEEHYLILCRKPEKTDNKTLPTEQRLTCVEGRLDDMQSQLDGLPRCIGDLAGCIRDVDSRIRNIEQFLKLAAAPGPERLGAA